MQALHFGVASLDITPPLGCRLWGYNPRPATSIDHPLRAEALACSNGPHGWLLLAADVGAFAAPLTRLLRADIARRTGLTPEAVMLTATHTHSGPHLTDAIWNEQSELESTYFQTLRERLATLAEHAWQARRPGTLVHGQAICPSAISNRRTLGPDGRWINEWNDPEGRHDGYCDATLDLVGVRRDDGALDALLVNFGCHPVCFGSASQAISGDYVSYLKDALEKHGGVGTTLFTVSGHGNIDPRDCCQTDPAVTRRMGETVAACILPALPSLAPVAGTGIAAAELPWQFQTTWEISDRMTIYFPHAARGATVDTTVAALAVGELALLGLPGETVSEYRRTFQADSPFRHTLLISLANDFVGYLPTDDILEQGAYEAMMSPLKPIQAALAARVAAVLHQAHARATPSA